jgi:hypothetical protein
MKHFTVVLVLKWSKIYWNIEKERESVSESERGGREVERGECCVKKAIACPLLAKHFK